MTPRPYKVGDRVEVVRRGRPNGRIGTVKACRCVADDDGYDVSLDGDVGLIWFFPKSLRLLYTQSPTPQVFKVGDRVGLTIRCSEYRGLGTLEKRGNRRWFVQFDNPKWNSWREARDLELITETKQPNNLQENETMSTKLSKTVKSKMKPDDIAVIEAFYSDGGKMLNTSSEEFGAWFMERFGKDEALILMAEAKLKADNPPRHLVSTE